MDTLMKVVHHVYTDPTFELQILKSRLKILEEKNKNLVKENVEIISQKNELKTR